MQIIVNKKKYILSFGMICWEKWFEKTSSYKKEDKPNNIDALADIIEAAILDANEVDRLNQKPIERQALRKWINQTGTTEEGFKTLTEIEKSLTDMFQYKQALANIGKKKSQPTQ